MASSSPPPPPDPNRNNPFNSGCNASTPSRPALRRAKTLANPESPTRWTREPLADVTNAVLGRDGTASRRLQVRTTYSLCPRPQMQELVLTQPFLPQRIDPELLLPIPAFSPTTTTAARRRAPSAENTPSSPSPSQSRIPRSTALRRTRSAAPTFRGGEPSSPSTGAFARHVAVAAPPTPASLHWPGARRTSPSPTAATASAEPSAPRALRPRPRPALGTGAPSSPTSTASTRRTRTVSDGAAAAYPSPPASSSAAASTGRRRTFGGSPSGAATGGTLAAVLEDERPEAVEVVSTPMTRSRSGCDGEGTTAGEGAADAESDRRLRRRRTVGGAADVVGGAASSPSSSSSVAPRRKGLR
ncbi:hypothetical protein JCM8208_005550 [Rhodotorula glutinis]